MRFIKQGFGFLLFWLINLAFISQVFCGTDSRPEKKTYVFVKSIRPAGNIILDDSSLKTALDMGSGFYLSPELLTLISEEAEGFYSSNGFHRVRVYLPQSKSIKGILDLKIDEQSEINGGQSDKQRAKIAVDRLVTRHSLKPNRTTKENAIATLVQRYNLKRSADKEMELLRIRAEQARVKIQREHYKEIEAKKFKAEEEIKIFQTEKSKTYF